MASNTTFNSTFQPSDQSFTVLTQDGTPVTSTIKDLDEFYIYSVSVAINYAAQLGASLMLLICVFMLTKPDKHYSPVFVLNVSALLVNFIRLILLCLFYTGPASELYAVITGDYSAVPDSAYATSVAGLVLSLVLVILIEISLFIQVQVVCVTLKRVYRHGIAALSTLVAMVAIGFRLAFTVENSKTVFTGESVEALFWLDSAVNITTTVSICYFCAIFVGKLGYALHQRQKLGIRRWTAMNMIFTMGCQTLFIPACFSILQYIGPIPAANSNTLTLTTIFLPLSSIWAGSALNGHLRTPHLPNGRASPGLLLGHVPKCVSTYTDSTASQGSPVGSKHVEVGSDLERQRH